MSWIVTAWAIKQKTGSTRRKAVLLALANYADPTGVCWPSQERLAEDTEQSVDSIQRHSLVLAEQKLIERELMPKRRGSFACYCYKLAMPLLPDGEAISSKGQVLRPGRTAIEGRTAPQSLRRKPSIEPSIEPSLAMPSATKARLAAFQADQEPLEVVQNRIAQRIGKNGWIVLGDMNDNQRHRLSNLERLGQLDERTLFDAVLSARLSPRL